MELLSLISDGVISSTAFGAENLCAMRKPTIQTMIPTGKKRSASTATNALKMTESED